MKSSKTNALVALALLVAVSLGCTGIRKPWRDYSERTFDSKVWLAGDALERGRMVQDIFEKRIADGKDRAGVETLFGDPDTKKTIEGKEVWFYSVDLGIAGGMDLLPISYDKKGTAYAGVVRGSTISILAKSDEI